MVCAFYGKWATGQPLAKQGAFAAGVAARPAPDAAAIDTANAEAVVTAPVRDRLCLRLP